VFGLLDEEVLSAPRSAPRACFWGLPRRSLTRRNFRAGSGPNPSSSVPAAGRIRCRPYPQRAESVVVRTRSGPNPLSCFVGDSRGLGPGASREQPDGVTQQWLEPGVFAHVSRASTERQTRFALAETERAQGSESSELPVRSVC